MREGEAPGQHGSHGTTSHGSREETVPRRVAGLDPGVSKVLVTCTEIVSVMGNHQRGRGGGVVAGDGDVWSVCRPCIFEERLELIRKQRASTLEGESLKARTAPHATGHHSCTGTYTGAECLLEGFQASEQAGGEVLSGRAGCSAFFVLRDTQGLSVPGGL